MRFVSENAANNVVSILRMLRQKGWWHWYKCLKELIVVNNARGVELGQLHDLLDQQCIEPNENIVRRVRELIECYDLEVQSLLRHEQESVLPELKTDSFRSDSWPEEMISEYREVYLPYAGIYIFEEDAP